MLTAIEQLDRPDFLSLSIVRSGSEFQASYEVTRGSFRVRFGATPSAAIAELFAPAPRDLPPPPY